MPKFDPLESPRIVDVILQIRKLNIKECILVRDYLSERVIKLKKQKLHPEKSIEDLGLSNRALFILKRHRLFTVKDVLDFKCENLLQSPGLGKETYNEICEVFLGKIKVPFRR